MSRSSPRSLSALLHSINRRISRPHPRLLAKDHLRRHPPPALPPTAWSGRQRLTVSHLGRALRSLRGRYALLRKRPHHHYPAEPLIMKTGIGYQRHRSLPRAGSYPLHSLFGARRTQLPQSYHHVSLPAKTWRSRTLLFEGIPTRQMSRSFLPCLACR